MRAWVLHQKSDIRYEEIENPELKENEVLLEVKACGICGSDVPRVYRGDAHIYPLVIGHEFSGIVRSVGKNASEKWIGKRVGVFPLIPCRKCKMCQAEKYEMCSNYNYLGSRSNGGFAQLAAVPESNLIELPDDVSYENAAMLEPMAVAVHAIRKGTDEFKLEKTANIVVCGLGTIGLLIVSFLLEAGYKNVFVIGNKISQKKRVMELGVTEDMYSEKWENDIDMNLYFECVGKMESIMQGLELLAPEGTMVTVGNPASDIEFPQKEYWKILRKQLRIRGTWNSSFTGKADDDWHYVLKKLEERNVYSDKIITHRLKLEELEKGLEIMRDKMEDYCKIMICG